VLVSHFFQGILNTCQKGLYLSKGQLVASGSAREIMDRYEQELFSVQHGPTRFPFRFPTKLERRQPDSTQLASAKPDSAKPNPNQLDDTGVELVSLYFEDAAGQLVKSPVSGEPLSICVRCRGSRPIGALSLFIAIYLPAKDNSLMLHLSSAYDQETFVVAVGDYGLRVELPYLGLLPASYTLSVYLKDGSLYVLDAYESIRFEVTGKEKLNRGQYYQPHSWQISEQIAREETL